MNLGLPDPKTFSQEEWPQEPTSGCNARPPRPLLPARLGLLYLSSNTWMVSCLYLHFTWLRIQLVNKPCLPRTIRGHFQFLPLPLLPLAGNTLLAGLGILAIGEGDPDVIVPNGIEHTQVLTHAHEAVRWKSVEETLSEGGSLRRAKGQ